ncbi:MAG: hypothetical protein ACTSRU_09425, partial [Candidatus Hodarchaeales archaeon]
TIVPPDEILQPNQPFNIIISSSERYDASIDGILWLENHPAGSYQFELNMSSAGDHVLEITVSGDYMIETTAEIILSVRMDYFIDVNIPSRIQQSNNMVMTMGINTHDGQPLAGFTAELFINGSLFSQGVSTQNGSIQLNLSLNPGFYELSLNIIPENTSTYLTKYITIDGGLIVYVVPVIFIDDIKPISGEITEIRAHVSSNGDALANVACECVLVNISNGESRIIGVNTSDDDGLVLFSWNVTETPGDYHVQVKNVNSEFLESITVSRSVEIIFKAPDIVVASIIPDYNFTYTIQVSVNFYNGAGSVFLYSDQRAELQGNLNYDDNTTLWSIQCDFFPGNHLLSIEAIDAQGLTSWVDLDVLTVTETSESVIQTANTSVDFISETLISLACLIPAALFYLIRRKKALSSANN